MPRPERPVDPAAGPIQAFAAELRKLRQAAGSPKYLQMARLTGRSRPALAEAAGGDHLPTWDTVQAFVTACRGDVVRWRIKWEEAKQQVDPPTQVRNVTSAAIVVHNKVAIGENGVAEDTTPAYLSAEPVARCAARGCKVPDTEVWSGAVLVARCWVHAATMTNRDLTSHGIERNAAGVSSDLWYEIILHDGRTGYLSEVYVQPEHRGGVGLPECRSG